jgi:predicted metal-binding membrane protein
MSDPGMDGSASASANLERGLIVAGALVVAGAGWSYLVFTDASMASAMFGMPGMGGWGAVDYLLAVVMWMAMMAGMMLPSALPVLLLYHGIARRSRELGRGAGSVGLFGLGYLLVWCGFSSLAAALQGLLATLSATTAERVATPWLGALLLVAAGIYQWSPFKQACLAHCRGPIDYLAHHWRLGPLGALEMGIRHGAYCLGCCWALMALLFVFGVMNLAWVAALALFVLAEKILPYRGWIKSASGAAFIAGGIGYAVWG